MYLKNHTGLVVTLVIAWMMGLIMTFAALVIDNLPWNYSNLFKIWAMVAHSILLVSLFIPYKAWGESLAELCGCRAGTVPYKLVSGIIPSLVLNTFITVLVSAANILYNPLIPTEAQIQTWISGMLHDWPVTLVISYFASFIAEYAGVKAASKCVQQD